MFERIIKFLAPPIFKDEDKTRTAALLNLILLTIFVIVTILTVVVVIIGAVRPPILFIGAGTSAATFGLWYVMRRGHVRLAGVLLALMLDASVSTVIYVAGTIRDPIIMAYIISIIIAGLFVGTRAAAVFTLLGLLLSFLFLQAEMAGLLPVPRQTSGEFTDWVIHVAVFSIIAVLLGITIDSIKSTLEQARRTTQEYWELSSSLEKQVAERTRALETSMEVSRHLSTILDQKELVAAVVEQVRSAFDYYYAHIYLVDETSGDPSTGSGQALVMAGGTGEAGRTMLARGHTIPAGKGLVGRAAETNSIVLIPDVSQDADWLPNPLLPETKAEVAVPIAIGERVLGVLDVQHDVAGGLGQAEADLIQAIANQVAIALQNTRLFAETQQRAEHEALIGQITRQIQSTTTVESTLQVAARELARALGAQRTQVQLEPRPQ